MSISGASRRRLMPTVMVSALLLGLVVASPAFAQTPWWHIHAETLPANLPPGGQGEIIVVMSNLGDAPIDGSEGQVSTSETLPPGLTATAIIGPGCSLATLKCTFKGILNPYEDIAVTTKVKVELAPGTVASLPIEASVEGGGAAKVARTLQVPVNSETAGFGMEDYELAPFSEDGSPAARAGEHPFELTTTLVVNQAISTEGAGLRQPVALPKDLGFQLPPGLVGNPNAVAQCTMANFFAFVRETNLCPPGSVVGVATVTASEPKFLKLFTRAVPVFNLVPSHGEPARLGFEVAGRIPVVLDTSVRSGHDYGVNAKVKDTTQTAGLLSSQVTLWGVPGDPRHDRQRGWECVSGELYVNEIGETCPAKSGLPEEPFLTLPTSCASDPVSEPVLSFAEADSWANPGAFLGAEYAWMNNEGQMLSFEDCGGLDFSPAIDVAPEQHSAATPTGLSVEVTVPQKTTLEADGRAEADVRDTTVTLSQGVQLSPSAANGLEGCSEAQVGFTGVNPSTQTDEFNTAAVTCPDGSKVGSVHIKTPLLSNELEGSVFLASPAPNGEAGRNPFDSLVALYLVAEDPVSGVLVKLAGEGRIDEGTLRISTTFRNAPQVPFEELKLDLFGGPRASVTTPSSCGSYATDATFTPWSGSGPVSVLSPAGDFSIVSGVDGSACPSGGLPFSPGFTAYSQDTQAGAFTGFALELARPDGDQALSGLSMHLAPGIAALLASVQLCSDAQAAASACPAGSEVGQAVAIAGLGSEPYVQKGGRVFITEGYGGAPFGLEIVTPAKAGPFDLGYVTVRSRLYIDPSNASVTIVSDPLPTQIRGIPLQLKRVLVTVDRSGFEFNPTSCDPMMIEGTITGAEEGSVNVSSPFKAEDCGALPFGPQLAASAVGQGSKANGTTFAVTVTSGGVGPGGVVQAGIAKVDLQLPKQLSSRLSTLQKACLEAVFDVNPASCDEGSVIGYATIHTPVLRNPLSGPAYLVSHGNAAFPDVEFVLQGEGIKLVLDGKTDIKGGITYSKFESTPDAPFTIFETVLPAGPHGVLTPNVAEAKQFSLCGETLRMPTTITAQNGVVLERSTNVAISGCAGVKSARAHKLTLSQRLKRALRACRHQYKRSKRKRVACERHARAHYTRLALAACRHQHKHAKRKRLACERAARKRFAARRAAHGKHS